nr:squalene/phytoene synthase family protein [Rubritepida sp.]
MSQAALAESRPAPAVSVAVTGPPNRDHDTENFPTASRILAPELRGKVMAFYRFVRTADDIADSTTLDAGEKIARLDAMEAALDDPRTALPEAARMHAERVGVEEARLMLSAFRQDARQARYADWAALVDYCRRSADPVGRMLLRLHDSDTPAARAAADALCTALQILNHLQDLVPDREQLDRVYVPTGWMDLAGGEAAFFDPANPRRRAVLDAMLDQVEEQLDRASGLPRAVAARRLAIQSAMTIGLARRLLAKLRAADPVRGRVALTKADFVKELLAAPLPGPHDRDLVAARVRRAGSSFAAGMATLQGERRRALWAVYAFCRAVDDIADGAMPEAEKRGFLAAWRGKLAAPDCALSRELALAARGFDLPRAECEAMVAGMETDAADHLRLPDEAALDLYCRQVAGSVGALSVRIFGAPDAEAWGLALGHTFQLTNIRCGARARLHPAHAARRRRHPARARTRDRGPPGLPRDLRAPRRTRGRGLRARRGGAAAPRGARAAPGAGDDVRLPAHPGDPARARLGGRAPAGTALAAGEARHGRLRADGARRGVIHVIGAGVAGLVAAHALARAGRPVTLHEAAPVAGGRARALPDGTDNGTHARIGANRVALRFLTEIGAREGWVEPEAEGLPVLDLADGSARRVALSPAGWWRADRRPAGVSPGAVGAMLAMALPGRDTTIAAAMARHPDFLRGFVDPLTIAALNTPAAEASTRRLGQVLRRLGAPGATRLYVARRGLGPDMVEPALAALAAQGGTVRTESRLRRLAAADGRASALHFQDRDVILGTEDRVVLALPPWEATRLLPDLPAPDAHAPIVNLHFARTGPGP